VRTVRSAGGHDLLAGVPLFSGLSKRHLRRLASTPTSLVPRAGSIVRQGQPGHVLRDPRGEAKVLRNGRTINRLEPGISSARSPCSMAVRDADVVADTPVSASACSRSVRQDGREEPVVASKIWRSSRSSPQRRALGSPLMLAFAIPYNWWKFLHVVGVLGFVLFHGVSIVAALRLRKSATAPGSRALAVLRLLVLGMYLSLAWLVVFGSSRA